MSNREALDGAFALAEWQLETAFQHHLRALERNHAAPICATLRRGRRAHTALERAALDLSTHGRKQK